MDVVVGEAAIMKVLVEPGRSDVSEVEVGLGVLDVVDVEVVLGVEDDVDVFRLRWEDVVVVEEEVEKNELVVVVPFVENGSPSAVVKPEAMSYGTISEHVSKLTKNLKQSSRY
jgi:hypothetical protein